MGKLLWLLTVVMAAAVPAGAGAQRYGTWDVPCDSYLGPRFAFPFASGVIFKEKEFLTNWRSTSTLLPHPSYNWYEASPNRDPVSTDGLAIWYYAQVQVHCWVERNPYYLTNHRDPVAYRGTVRARTTACGAGPTTFTNAGFEEYDPYEPSSTSPDDCGDGTGFGGSGIQFAPGDYTGGETVDWNTGIGDGGTSACGLAAKVEYVCLEKQDDAGNWSIWTCGYATTC